MITRCPKDGKYMRRTEAVKHNSDGSMERLYKCVCGEEVWV